MFLCGDNLYNIFAQYNPHEAKVVLRDNFDDLCETIYAYNVTEYDRPSSNIEARQVLEDLLAFGLCCEREILINNVDYKSMLCIITQISISLSIYAPDYFFPYFFVCRFLELRRLCDYLNIDLPEVPQKNDWRGRCLYYMDICEVMIALRSEIGMTPAEFCVFIYEFLPNMLKSEADKVSAPSCVWVIGGKQQTTEAPYNQKGLFWQANAETKRGDILLFYETTPVCAITAMYIAQSDGITDPLFYYYSNTYISNKIEITPISIRQLKQDLHFHKHPLIKKNFQGVNGWMLTPEDYNRIMELAVLNGDDVNAWPNLPVGLECNSERLGNERDVEIHLLEPLLKAMGYIESVHYKRQLGIHAGRGHRIYPDFVLNYSDKPNEEYARVLIEAKFWMRSNRDIASAFYQARSYALLLQAHVFILCDKNCLMIYQKLDEAFDQARYIKFFWYELSNATNYNKLRQILALGTLI